MRVWLTLLFFSGGVGPLRVRSSYGHMSLPRVHHRSPGVLVVSPPSYSGCAQPVFSSGDAGKRIDVVPIL